MAIDSRGVEYAPFLPSVGCADGAVFQVVTDMIDPDTGLHIVDMAASAALADQHDAQRGANG